MLEKEKKIYPMEHSDRVMSKDKVNIQVSNRDRKKSEVGYSRSNLESGQMNPKLE